MRASGILFQLDAGVFKYLGVLQMFFKFAQLHLWRDRWTSGNLCCSLLSLGYVSLPHFTYNHTFTKGKGLVSHLFLDGTYVEKEVKTTKEA